MKANRCIGLLAAVLVAGEAAAETCPRPRDVQRGAPVPAGCASPAPRKVEPYDPDRLKAGSRPGFIDLGNGTEVRIGGRARMDYDVRR